MGPDMPTPESKPLWQVMADAYHSTVHDFDNVPHAYAAEIRALVEARLPEEPPIDLLKLDMKGPDRIRNFARVIQRDERQRLRLLLLADADEAEKSDA